MDRILPRRYPLVSSGPEFGLLPEASGWQAYPLCASQYLFVHLQHPQRSSATTGTFGPTPRHAGQIRWGNPSTGAAPVPVSPGQQGLRGQGVPPCHAQEHVSGRAIKALFAHTADNRFQSEHTTLAATIALVLTI